MGDTGNTMSYYVKKHRAVKVVFAWQKKFIQFTNEEMRRALETSKLIDDLFGEKCKKNMDTLNMDTFVRRKAHLVYTVLLSPFKVVCITFS